MSSDFGILAEGIYTRNQLLTAWRPGARNAAGPYGGTTTGNLQGPGSLEGDGKGYHSDECRLLDWEQQRGLLLLEFGPARLHAGIAMIDCRPANRSHASTAFLTDGAGVCSVVRSSDGHLIVQKRSENHIRYPGWYHVCGGMLETQRIDDRMVVEPFVWLQIELHEELSIDPVYISSMLCLGLVRDLRNSRPELVFQTVLRVPTERFAQRRGPEHSDLLLIEDAADNLRRFVADHSASIVPSGLACLMLYGKQRFGRSWYQETLEIVAA